MGGRGGVKRELDAASRMIWIVQAKDEHINVQLSEREKKK